MRRWPDVGHWSTAHPGRYAADIYVLILCYMSQLIPTINRDKLPKHWSYPVGAELVSNALADLPQYNTVDLFFYYRERMSLTTFKQDSLERLERLKHFKSTYGFQKIISVIWALNKWGVSIFAVPSEERLQTKQIIQDVGLPRIFQWLNQDHPSTWFESIHRFEFGLKKGFREGCFWEIHNSSVENAEFFPIDLGDTAT